MSKFALGKISLAMTEVKFDICSRVYYLNTASAKIEQEEIKGIQIVPTGISKDEAGRSVLDGKVVLYQTVDGPVLAECEVFATEDECRTFWQNALTLDSE